MNNIDFSTGIETFLVNGKHELKVNFNDSELYYKIVKMPEYIESLSKDIPKEKDKLLDQMHELDTKMKSKLAEVFGKDNDFDVIFDGINVMAFDKKGNRIIENFLNAITPIIERSAEDWNKYAEKETKALVGNRAQRRAKNKQE